MILLNLCNVSCFFSLVVLFRSDIQWNPDFSNLKGKHKNCSRNREFEKLKVASNYA